MLPPVPIRSLTMAHLGRLVKYSCITRNVNILRPVFSLRNAHWNKDYQPGPYPNTPEERAAAAKRYGLLPEDYEPYPDDGLGYGDYPKLPPVSADSRDPHYNWDFPEYKKNFGEPLHKDFDMYGHDRYDVNRRYKRTPLFMASMFLGTMIGGYILLEIFENYKYVHPYMPKQYPGPGVVNYTFERPDS